MSIDNISIHDFDFNLICEYFSHMERQGPGSPEATLRALSFIEPLTDSAHIADIGCGTGGQTMTLAQHCPGRITGIDLFPTFIDLFNRNAAALNLQERVKGIQGDMTALPFAEEELDLIWSEGALYCMGFVEGLAACHSLLVPGGAMGVSELCWFQPDPPDDCLRFFTEEYPPMIDIAANLAAIQAAGFDVVGHFSLPESSWRDSYYAPMKPRLQVLRQTYADDAAGVGMLDMLQREIDMYERFSAYYGYEFFLMRT